ncbi:MAG: sirohydrochlorin ferrochelatase [Kiritimatiellia bacterium]|jgi:sirohydrochlorin ferrochelatase
MKKHVLIIMAHGSRKTEANNEFEQLIKVMSTQGLDYIMIKHCFLEMAEPNLPSVIEECLSLGYKQFDLYPLFFNQGNHVSRDIPEQIQAVQQQHPECSVRQLDYFGSFDQLAHGITEHIYRQNT